MNVHVIVAIFDPVGVAGALQLGYEGLLPLLPLYLPAAESERGAGH